MTRWSLIIAATQRSGSTLLGRILELTDVVGKPREWLQNTDMEERTRAYNLTPGTGYAEIVREIVRREHSHAGVFALKIMWDTMDAFLDIIHKEHPETRSFEDSKIIQDYFPRPKFVFLQREDKLRQAISFVKSLQTNEWIAERETEHLNQTHLVFDYIAISEALAKFETEDRLWRQFLTASNFDFVEVTYEELQSDPQRVIRRIFEHLGLSVSRVPGLSETGMRVMADTTNKEWHQRYTDVEEAISRASPVCRRLKPAEDEGKCSITSCPENLVCGERFRISFTLENTGAQPWPSVGGSHGDLWIVVRGRWTPPNKCAGTIDSCRIYLHRDLHPREADTISGILQAPDEPDDYSLSLDVWQEGVGWIPTKTNEKTTPRLVRVRPIESDRLAAKFFPEATRLLAGWSWVPWLGHIYTRNLPWLYHNDFGWMLIGIEGTHGGDYWFFMDGLGWLKTSLTEFPQMYLQQYDRWADYLGMENGLCRFRCLQTKDIIEAKPTKR